jgi:peptidoglycan/LPS O-acetylase OafA/YrhL
MLVETTRNGCFDFWNFYARRALRILPVYFAFLVVIYLLQLLIGYHQSGRVWLSNLTFTTDFSGRVWTTGHLWSLAVEEQFYLLWPILFVLCGLAARLRPVLIILAIPILLAPLFRVATYTKFYPHYVEPFFDGYSFFNYFDSLAIGCACAVVYARKREEVKTCLMFWPAVTSCAGIALILIPYALIRLFIAGVFTVPLNDSFQALGFGILLLQSILAPNYGFYRILNWNFVREIGILSYSIYIWQQLFCTEPKDFRIGTFWWMSFPGWLVPAFVIAIVSFYCFERPLFRLRARFRNS